MKDIGTEEGVAGDGTCRRSQLTSVWREMKQTEDCLADAEVNRNISSASKYTIKHLMNT